MPIRLAKPERIQRENTSPEYWERILTSFGLSMDAGTDQKPQNHQNHLTAMQSTS